MTCVTDILHYLQPHTRETLLQDSHADHVQFLDYLNWFYVWNSSKNTRLHGG